MELLSRFAEDALCDPDPRLQGTEEEEVVYVLLEFAGFSRSHTGCARLNQARVIAMLPR